MAEKVGIGMVARVGIGISPKPMNTKGKATIAKMVMWSKVGIGMSQKVGIGEAVVLPNKLPKTTQRKAMEGTEQNEVIKANMLLLR